MARRTKVLVVTYDQVGPRMAGPAIRAYEMSRVLGRDHDVTLACRLKPERAGDGFAVAWFGEDDVDLKQAIHDAEVVVAFGFLLVEHPEIVEQGKVVIVDAYDPFTLEVLVQRAGDSIETQQREHWNALTAMNRQLRVGDLVLVASDRQRDLVAGMMGALNRINPLTFRDDLVRVVPFGLPSEPPTSTTPALRGVHDGFGPDDFVLLWAGGIYEWFDPLSLIRAMALLDDRDDNVKLFFMGTAHPNPEVPEMAMGPRALQLAGDLDVLGRRVFFNDGWVPYDDRVGYLLEADVGVSTHFRHLETAYAFRTRMLDYIWAGLPILCTEGDTLADLVKARDLGEVVPPDDPDAIASAIEWLRDDGRRATCAANLRELAGELTWDRVLRPVVDFLADPRHAADLAANDGEPPRTPSEQHLVDVADAQLDEKRGELEALHSKIFDLRREREAHLREIDELAAFREEVLDRLPYRIKRRLAHELRRLRR